MNLRKEPILF